MKTMHVSNFALPSIQQKVMRTEQIDREELLYGWGDDRYLDLVRIHNAQHWRASEHISVVLCEGAWMITSMGCHPLLRQCHVIKHYEEQVYEPYVESERCYDSNDNAIGVRIVIRGELYSEKVRRTLADVFVRFDGSGIV